MSQTVGVVDEAATPVITAHRDASGLDAHEPQVSKPIAPEASGFQNISGIQDVPSSDGATASSDGATASSDGVCHHLEQSGSPTLEELAAQFEEEEVQRRESEQSLRTRYSPVSQSPEQAQWLATQQPPLFEKMMEGLCQQLEFFLIEEKMPPAEAIARVRAIDRFALLQEVDKLPVQGLTWNHFRVLEHLDPSLVGGAWDKLQQVAQAEIESGHYSAKAVERPGISTPFDRAVYLALRASYSADWQPRNAIEQSLIDQMAQAYTQYVNWSEKLNIRSTLEAHKEEVRLKRWRMPNYDQAQSIEQAANLADRFQKMFLRAQRALRDLRRYPVLIQNAGQVNLGQQQVNVVAAKTRKPRKSDPQDRAAGNSSKSKKRTPALPSPEMNV